VVILTLLSGKSSVLEAFSGLPFARNSGLCTRFATQITMRRADYESIIVSIYPASGSDPKTIEKLKAFKKDGQASFGNIDFLATFKEVSN
jgi:hypothetical protein